MKSNGDKKSIRKQPLPYSFYAVGLMYLSLKFEIVG